MRLPRPLLLFAPLLAAASLMVAACTSVRPATDASTVTRVAALIPADAVLLGEQHNAPDHHRIERETVQALVDSGKLAALALEMAEDGASTATLPSSATEPQVRTALAWQEKGWPWEDYGPAIMVAVRAGVPVLGANLPRSHMKDAMADVSLDVQLSDKARAQQQEAVRDGHCDLLPASQILPMTRIQIARDRSMAQVVVKARQPGKTVLLITGNGHALRTLGVPQHMPTDVKVVSVQMLAAAEVPFRARPEYDAIWQTAALPEKDYCAELRK